MKMVFVYEDKVARDTEGNYYSGSAFSQEVFDRYLRHFDHITLLMRKAAVDPNDKEALGRMNRIDTKQIDVVFVPYTTESVKSFLNPAVHRNVKKIVISEIDKADAVVIRAPSGTGYIAAKYCASHKKPYLAEAVGCPWDSLWNHSLRGKVMAPFIRNQMCYTMKHASYAIYVTDKFLQGRYPTEGKEAAISDVELQKADESVIKGRLEHIHHHDGKMKIGTAAAVHVAFKGQKYVIEAIAKMKEKGNTGIEYHLAGGGDQTPLRLLARKLKVEENIIFDGSISHDAMFSWFDRLDVYIQPSRQEGMPRALIEAMSRGLPAFGSDIGGIPELLGHDCIFHAGDAEEISEKIESLTTAKMESMAKRNFEYALRFDKDRLEKERESIYSDFASAVK